MFNHTLLIMRRRLAVVAVTIAIGLQARTPSTLALAPKPAWDPRIAGLYAPIANAAPRETRSRSRRRLGGAHHPIRTRRWVRSITPTRTRLTSTRAGRRAGRA